MLLVWCFCEFKLRSLGMQFDFNEVTDKRLALVIQNILKGSSQMEMIRFKFCSHMSSLLFENVKWNDEPN